MSEMTQQGWEAQVDKVLAEWFGTSPESGPDADAPEDWADIVGQNGSVLRGYLNARDLTSVLTILCRLVVKVLSDRDYSDAETLMHFLEEGMERLRLPRLELKHLWAADQWHDFPGEIDIFKEQDIARARICLRELESGSYYARGLRWPWYTGD
jgi:hypothetical protein